MVKIKVRPEDFVVREEPEVELGERPDRYAVFRLGKRDWDTFDLLDLLARRLGVRPGDISVGGFKDRFGSTEQLVSVRSSEAGPPKAWKRGLRERNFTLELAGYSPEPVTARSIRGNHFTITLRDLDPQLVPRYRERAESLQRWGIPNYYDEQRFGSARHGKGFMGKEVFLGHRERALRLYFEPSRHDDRRTRALKSCVTGAWGRWDQCLEDAFGEYRDVLEYLKGHPRAWRQALIRIDRRFLVFVLNAYQSYLFNELLTERLVELAGAHELSVTHHTHRWGVFLFYGGLPPALFDALSRTSLPVPGYDSEPAEENTRRVLERVLRREGITLADLRVRQLPRISVHGVERPMLVVPRAFEASDPGEDELYRGKMKMTLRFGLPRGCYATLVVKCLSAAGGLPQRLLEPPPPPPGALPSAPPPPPPPGPSSPFPP
jgi:tRNA pseudouridine13 synthase